MCRLCFKRKDGELININLTSDSQSMDYVDNSILLLENYSYTLSIQCEEEIESVELVIGDFAFDMNYDSAQKMYMIRDRIIFEGCYDLTRIVVILTDYRHKEQILFSSYLRVASSKQTISKINGMLEEVEKNYPKILNFCFSKCYKESGLEKNSNRSVRNTIQILDEIISIYNDNFGMFNNYSNSKIIRKDAIVDAHAMRNINQSSLNWLVSNPENLIDTTRERKGIKIGKKYYLPEKVYISVNTRYSGTYENQVILGFLKKIKVYLDEAILKFEREANKANDIPNEIIMKIPNTHDLTGRCVQAHYKIIVDELKRRREMICELYYRYQRILGCDELIVDSIPKLTNVFKQVKQYRLCYECILKWFEEGEYTFDSINYMFNLKTLSKIFEYLCLVRLQDAFIQKGYQLTSFDKINYLERGEVDSINNKYVFNNGKYRIVLYYEPYLCCDKCYDEIELYSTGYNFSKGKWSPYWNPDYLLMIESEKREYYYVLDAKFSNYKNVKKYHLKEVVLKYGMQLASVNKYFSDILGIGILYLEDRNNINYFKRNINNISSLPLIFSIDIGAKEESILENAVEELIKQIEYFETYNGYII